VPKAFFGTEVAADNKLIIVVFFSNKRGFAAPDRLVSISKFVLLFTTLVPLTMLGRSDQGLRQ
jgi:hypothetical protein